MGQHLGVPLVDQACSGDACRLPDELNQLLCHQQDRAIVRYWMFDLTMLRSCPSHPRMHACTAPALTACRA